MFTIFLSKVWEKRYQIISLATEQRFSMCPVSVSSSMRINPYSEATSDMERENLLDNREQEESREAGGEHTLMCGYSLMSTLLSVPRSLFLTVTFSRGHRWSVFSGLFVFFSLSNLVFTCNTTSPPVLASAHQGPLEGRAGPTAEEETLVLLSPSSPSLSHQCPQCICSSWGDFDAISLLPRLWAHSQI